jgi:CysZ protein
MSEDGRKTGVIRGFIAGLSGATEGFLFLCRYPGLWRYGIWPVLVNIVVALVVWLGAFQIGRMFWQSMVSTFPDTWWAPIIEWGVFVGLIVLTLGLGVIGYIVLQGVFCGYFFSLLARHVEMSLGVAPGELKDVRVPGQITDALRAAFKLIVVNVFLLLLQILPVVGAVAALIIGGYLNAYILGSEFLGYPMELRGIRWIDRQRYAKRQLAHTLGLGSIVSILILIPVVGALLQATSVVGAVLIHRRLAGLPTEVTAECVES